MYRRGCGPSPIFRLTTAMACCAALPSLSARPGLPGFPFHDAIAPAPGDDVTVKTKSSAFHGTDFDAKLKARGIDHLVVTGMQSEYCVDSAVRGAYERGYKVTLVSDAHSTGDTRVAKA